MSSVAGEADGLNLAIPLLVVMKMFPEAVFTNREVFVMEMLIGTCVRFSFSSW